MESSSSSPSSTSHSNGPRPLATKPEYIRRSRTSKSGLLSSSTTPNAAPSNADSTGHELDHFFFKRPVSDSLLQPNAKRARKIYRSILHDHYYLLDLKQMWQTKLKKLQMEQVLLEQMCVYTQEDVNDIPPLFSQIDSNQQQEHQQLPQPRRSPFLQRQQRQPDVLQQNQPDDSHSLDLWIPSSSTQYESTPASPRSSVYNTADDGNSDMSQSGRNTSRNSPVLATATAAAEITATPTAVKDNDTSHLRLDEHSDNNSDTNNNDLLDWMDSGNDSNGDDNGEEEDEETARRALTFMLAHYGNDL